MAPGQRHYFAYLEYNEERGVQEDLIAARRVKKSNVQRTTEKIGRRRST